jgi:transcriptional regulator with XRE-family HTH domain
LEARKQLGISQKELAARIKREDGVYISPQYLNDIEHDRRSPTGPHIIDEFAKTLKLDVDYLSFLAGQFPSDLTKRPPTEEEFKTAFQAFRRDIKKDKRWSSGSS